MLNIITPFLGVYDRLPISEIHHSFGSSHEIMGVPLRSLAYLLLTDIQ